MRPALVAIVIVALAAAAAANPEPARNRSSEHPDQAQGITWYGNWCGGGHGGYQDCCNGGPCPACNWHDAGVTDDCLAQCPPVDDMDAACSRHDYCCFQNPLPSGLSCSPEGNRCMCDCNLIAGVQAASCGSLSCSAYSEELIETFTHVLSCYYYGSGPSDDAQACSQVQCPEGWCTSCSMSPSCNGDISGQYSVTQFC